VIAYAIALAFIVRLLDKLCRSGGIMALPAGIYFSIFLIFALRGALMIAMAYGSGALMAFLTIGWFVSGKRRLHTRRSRNVRPLGPTPVRPAI